MALKKSLVFVMCMLVAAIVAASMAEAQLGVGTLGGHLGFINEEVAIFCTANGRMGLNGPSMPVFPNAPVQLQCANGNVVSSTTTNGSGGFSILLNPLNSLLTSLLQDCRLVVATPLSNCNASLPSVGRLTSAMHLLENIPGGLLNIVGGLLNIVSIIPLGFNFLPNING